ncbi:hypothetical protein UlMin_001491 [Ulmus minor]
MEQRLEIAAKAGDIDGLYLLLKEDAYLLEGIDQVPYINTPLHVAASTDNIMRLKPSFARKLNPDGYSPIHLALQHGQTQMVLRLLDFDRDLVRVQGREGKTPLHFAAEYDMIDLLAEFLSVCPESIQDSTIQKETALHIAVKNNKLEVLQVLVGWLQLVEKDNKILNWTDDEGNSVLHLAASRNQLEMVKLFIKRADINAKNFAGLTALDILEDQRQDYNEKLRLMLLQGGALRRSSRPCLPTLADSLSTKTSWHEKWIISHYRKFLYMSYEERNIILLVAVLFATSNYQALLTKPSSSHDSSSYNSLSHDSSSYHSSSYHSLSHDSSSYDSLSERVVYGYDLFSMSMISIYSLINNTAFLASMIEIYFHLPHGSGILQLVLPLVVLYVMLTSWNPLPMSMFIVLFIFYFSKLPVILNKFIPILVYRKSLEIKLSMLTHCSNFHRKFAA